MNKVCLKGSSPHKNTGKTIPIIISVRIVHKGQGITYYKHTKTMKEVCFLIDKTYQKFAIVTSDTAQGFETELNKKMEELGKWNPEVEFNMNQGHCAYIRYEERIRIPENTKDEYELKGIKYVCGECPFYELSQDKRVKYSTCGNGERVHYDRSACNELYEKIKKGEVEL